MSVISTDVIHLTCTDCNAQFKLSEMNESCPNCDKQGIFKFVIKDE